ncbi:MAG: deoxyribodipyrimidine photo-lyase, partial [Flavobacteriales bacterium]
RPEVSIPSLASQFNIDNIYLQKEWTWEERNVLTAVTSKLPPSICLEESYDQFLFHPEDIPYDSFQTIPEVFTAFRKKCEKYSNIRPCLPKLQSRPPENLVGNSTSVPTLEDLGLSSYTTDRRSAFPFEGGETNALERIDNYFWETKNLAIYKKTRNGLVG